MASEKNLNDAFKNMFSNFNLSNGKLSNWWQVYGQPTFDFDFKQLVNFAKASMFYQALVGDTTVIEEDIFLPSQHRNLIKDSLISFLEDQGYRTVYIKRLSRFMITEDSAILLNIGIADGSAFYITVITRNKKKLNDIRDKCLSLEAIHSE